MTRTLACFALASLLLPACGDDDGGGSATTVGATSTGGSTSTSSTSSGGGSSSATTDEPTTTTDASTGPATTGDTSGGTTGSVNACDPVVPGEWNSCVDENGGIDNTLCNWMGSSDAVGFITCLSSSSNPDANVCIIEGCVDDCDCFAPPSTGTAPVVCAEILADGGNGCALSCADGEQCPDTMECLDGLCFHSPA